MTPLTLPYCVFSANVAPLGTTVGTHEFQHFCLQPSYSAFLGLDNTHSERDLVDSWLVPCLSAGP